MVPAMQSELIAKGTAKNRFATDIGDPTSRAGGVPGGNSVTARWALEPSHALLVEVTLQQEARHQREQRLPVQSRIRLDAAQMMHWDAWGSH